MRGRHELEARRMGVRQFPNRTGPGDCGPVGHLLGYRRVPAVDFADGAGTHQAHISCSGLSNTEHRITSGLKD